MLFRSPAAPPPAPRWPPTARWSAGPNPAQDTKLGRTPAPAWRRSEPLTPSKPRSGRLPPPASRRSDWGCEGPLGRARGRPRPAIPRAEAGGAACEPAGCEPGSPGAAPLASGRRLARSRSRLASSPGDELRWPGWRQWNSRGSTLRRKEKKNPKSEKQVKRQMARKDEGVDDLPSTRSSIWP